jgi:hypothetical protein
VKRLAIALATTAACVGALVLVLLAATSLPQERLVDGYVLFVGGLVLLGLVRATGDAAASAEASAYERALRRRERAPARPRELAKLEREVALAATSSFDLHFRLRPVLREVAAYRLGTRRGLDLDGGSPDVRAALGEELWEIVDPGREPPEDRFAPGLRLERLRDMLERVERI